MPSQVKGLSEVLRTARTKIADAGKLAEKLERQTGDLNDALKDVEGVSQEIQSATAELRAMTGALSNNPPQDDK